MQHTNQPLNEGTPGKSSGARGFQYSKKMVIVAGAIILTLASYIFIRQYPIAETKTPEYQTVLPSGKSINELGGWKRVSPPEKEPVFAYMDTIGETPINVSQQPLPKSFQDNPGSDVAELAQKFNATTKIDVNGTPLYIGTSTKGPQSAIFTKGNVLILIKSQAKVSESAWVSYAKSLQSSE